MHAKSSRAADSVLDEVAQSSVTALDMPAHGTLGGPVIARLDGGDDGVVLVHRLFGDLAPETGAEDMDMDVQPRQRVRDQMIAGALRNQAMEVRIHVGEGVM